MNTISESAKRAVRLIKAGEEALGGLPNDRALEVIVQRAIDKECSEIEASAKQAIGDIATSLKALGERLVRITQATGEYEHADKIQKALDEMLQEAGLAGIPIR